MDLCYHKPKGWCAICGIAGYIGCAKKPKMTYLLISEIFKILEIRGTDASGVWGTEFGADGQIVYHKEPLQSSAFVKTRFWQNLVETNLDMLIVHARAASKGVEHAEDNKNNHPFVSEDMRIALIHNGTLEEANFLKDKYQIKSDTDSEFLLRMYEHGLDKDYPKINGVPDEVAQRLNATREIWSLVNSGAMAVAIGERMDDGQRNLFLFRNEQRPLWIADMRDVLGQVFFFSSPDIWYRAVTSNEELKKLCWGSQKLLDVPPHQVWCMTINKQDVVVVNENLFKFKVSVSRSGKDWQKGDYVNVKAGQPNLKIISGMNQISEKSHKSITQCLLAKIKPEYEFEEPFQDHVHGPLCNEITQLSSDIFNTVGNMLLEESISTHDYEELVNSLKQTKVDLQNTLQILRN